MRKAEYTEEKIERIKIMLAGGHSIEYAAKEYSTTPENIKSLITQGVPLFISTNVYKCHGCNNKVFLKPCAICYSRSEAASAQKKKSVSRC